MTSHMVARDLMRPSPFEDTHDVHKTFRASLVAARRSQALQLRQLHSRLPPSAALSLEQVAWAQQLELIATSEGVLHHTARSMMAPQGPPTQQQAAQLLWCDGSRRIKP